MLLDKNPDNINLEDIWQRTGFVHACQNNSLQVVELLLDKNLDIINKEEEYSRAFMHACWNNNLEIVKVLLQRYPDIVNKNEFENGFISACENSSL